MQELVRSFAIQSHTVWDVDVVCEGGEELKVKFEGEKFTLGESWYEKAVERKRFFDDVEKRRGDVDDISEGKIDDDVEKEE